MMVSLRTGSSLEKDMLQCGRANKILVQLLFHSVVMMRSRTLFNFDSLPFSASHFVSRALTLGERFLKADQQHILGSSGCVGVSSQKALLQEEDVQWLHIGDGWLPPLVEVLSSRVGGAFQSRLVFSTRTCELFGISRSLINAPSHLLAGTCWRVPCRLPKGLAWFVAQVFCSFMCDV